MAEDAQRRRNRLADIAFRLLDSEEGKELMAYLRAKADAKTLVKDANGATDPYATMHALGWRDSIKHLEAVINNGRVARTSD